MKKILAVLLSAAILLVGCGKEQKDKKENQKKPEIPKGNSCEFLVDANWEGDDGQCVNVISFKSDGGFSNWCYCGSPVGDGDIIERYSYNDADKTVTLYDDENSEYEKGKILFCDENYLIIKLWSKTYIYENIDSELPTVFSSAYTDVYGEEGEEVTKAFVKILSFENDKMVITDYDYDGDAKDMFDTWEIPVSADASFKSVMVTVENGVETLETKLLTQKDFSTEDNSSLAGYITLNPDGQVDSVVVYGSIEIW